MRQLVQERRGPGDESGARVQSIDSHWKNSSKGLTPLALPMSELQALGALLLHPEAVAFARSLPDGLRGGLFTEHEACCIADVMCAQDNHGESREARVAANLALLAGCDALTAWAIFNDAENFAPSRSEWAVSDVRKLAAARAAVLLPESLDWGATALRSGRASITAVRDQLGELFGVALGEWTGRAAA